MSARRLLIPVLALLVAVGFGLSLFAGSGTVAFNGAWWSLVASDETLARTIFFDVRLPRALLALFVGASLGLSGAALQGLLRNPLADPGVIGTASGAALGAVIIFYFGLAGSFSLALPVGGMLGASIAAGLLFAVAGWNASTLTLVLAGVAVAALTTSLTSLALNLAPSPFAALEITFWMLGSLTDRSFEHVYLAVPFMVLGGALLLRLGPALDALTLGDDIAQSLGIAVRRIRLLAVLGTTLAVGAAVSVAGVIAFIGLVAPHLVRPAAGQLPGRVLLPAALSGAALLLFADLAVRLIIIDPELKVGVVTSLIGAPFFLWLIAHSRREGI